MDAPWYASYETGVPREIPEIGYTSLADFCEKVCKKFADKPAFNNFDTIITYKQVDTYTTQFASFLLNELKLTKGDRVAVMMPNILQYPVGIMGILRAGLVVVNINPMYTTPKAILVWDGAADIVQTVMGQLPNLQVITTKLGDLFPPLKGSLIQFVLKYIKRKIHSYNISHAWDFKKTLQIGASKTLPTVAVGLDDLAFLQYTGGTTGMPKGAMLTHHNMLANMIQAAVWVTSKHQPGDADIILSPLPFYHIFSLLANCLLFMHMGAHNILITDPRDIHGFIKIMKKYHFQFMSGVNTLFNALLQDPRLAEVDFSKLKTSLAGGMALQGVIADKWQKATGKVLSEGYGLTEASPAVTITPMNAVNFNGSAGLPISSTDVQVRDEAGKVLALNQPGELWVKGPQVMRGYWQQESETKNVLDDQGWLRTGDVAKIDDKGFVYLVDRIKDMILVSGFKVYPNDIEDEIAKMPGVLEVAAVGIPDEHSGEAVKLFIVKKDPNLTEDDVRKFCHDNLTGYKRPKVIEFRDSLPKSNVGKILRRELREP